MNILILSNNAPNFQHFFGHLAQRLNNDGHQISYAVDCEFSSAVNKLGSLPYELYVFENFFAEHKIDELVLERYSHVNLNFALLSDFERAQIYDIGCSSGLDFYSRLKSALLCFFEQIFRKQNTDVILYEPVSNTFAYFALIVGQSLGINYCGLGSSRLPGRFSIGSDPFNDNLPCRFFEDLQSGKVVGGTQAISWCENYLSQIDSVVPDYMRSNGLTSTRLWQRYAKVRHLRTIYLLLVYSLRDCQHSFQVGLPIRHYFNLVRRNILRRMKLPALNRMYDPVVQSDVFLLYPLHFHPESSTSILAGAYLNEYEVIRNIAFNLPQGITLYVKDHMAACGFQQLAFYRKLKDLPNVRLISYTADAKQLIRKSVGVITLTSTVGYEALLLGKRVFLFGSVFYEFHKNVVRVHDPRHLFSLLSEHLLRKVEIDHRYNSIFILAYFLATRAGALDLTLTNLKAKAMVDSVYAQICEHLDTLVPAAK